MTQTIPFLWSIWIHQFSVWCLPQQTSILQTRKRWPAKKKNYIRKNTTNHARWAPQVKPLYNLTYDNYNLCYIKGPILWWEKNLSKLEFKNTMYQRSKLGGSFWLKIHQLNPQGSQESWRDFQPPPIVLGAWQKLGSEISHDLYIYIFIYLFASCSSGGSWFADILKHQQHSNIRVQYSIFLNGGTHCNRPRFTVSLKSY